MAEWKLIAYDEALNRMILPDTDTYLANRDLRVDANFTVTGTLNGYDMAVELPKVALITITGAVDLDALKAKSDFLTVTQAVDLDVMESRLNELDAAVVLKGSWDASTLLFPTSTMAGESWICSVAGTVDGVDFAVGDRVIALIDSAPNNSYAGNWLKLDYTDKVSSVAGRTGNVVLTESDITDLQSYLLATDIDSVAKLNGLVGDTLLTAASIDTLAELNAIVADTNVLAADGSVPLTANWDLGSFDLTFQKAIVDSVQFDLAAALTPTQGQMVWDADEETVSLGQNGAILQLGQETQYHVRNNTGVTINNGEAVMASGTVGASGRITVSPMDGSVVANARYFLGLATEDIGNGEDGKITAFGKVRGIKTDYAGWNEGDVLWVDAASPGGLTPVEPASGCRLAIAFIVTKHATEGVLAVRATEGTYIHHAHDTAISSLVAGHVLQYNGTVWTNVPMVSAAYPSISSLTAYATGGQTNGTLVTAGVINIFDTVATAGDSGKLPPAAEGTKVEVWNRGAEYLDLFPNTSDKIATRAIDVAMKLYPGQHVTLLALDNELWEFAS